MPPITLERLYLLEACGGRSELANAVRMADTEVREAWISAHESKGKGE